MTRVKICGITNFEDALDSVEEGADALGFVFYPKSPRHINPEDAKDIISRLPPFIVPVGVFVDASVSEIMNIIERIKIQVVQLHGQETPEFCRQFPTKVIKAFHVKDDNKLTESISRYNVDAFLLDTYSQSLKGGTGKSFKWEKALEVKQFGPVILAGGLTPENVTEAIVLVKPYAVDVSSGVELRPGKKDKDRIREFIQRVRKCKI